MFLLLILLQVCMFYVEVNAWAVNVFVRGLRIGPSAYALEHIKRQLVACQCISLGAKLVVILSLRLVAQGLFAYDSWVFVLISIPACAITLSQAAHF